MENRECRTENVTLGLKLHLRGGGAFGNEQSEEAKRMRRDPKSKGSEASRLDWPCHTIESPSSVQQALQIKQLWLLVQHSMNSLKQRGPGHNQSMMDDRSLVHQKQSDVFFRRKSTAAVLHSCFIETMILISLSCLSSI